MAKHYTPNKTISPDEPARNPGRQGKLIVFEGMDGSGKSTQYEIMCDRLTAENRDFMRVRFPRYDKPSSALLRMYLGGEFGDDPDAVNAYAASSFFAVDRFASFKQDWSGYYRNGGLILTDRYTTSNAIHQGAKLPQEQRERFFIWLYEYEFDLLGLPAPELVVFLDIEAEQAARRLRSRQAETDTVGDIHENDAPYLKQCALCGKQAAALYNWRKVSCFADEHERTEEEIHSEIYEIISGLIPYLPVPVL